MNSNLIKVVCLTVVVVLGTVLISFTILSAKTDPNNIARYKRPPVMFLEKYHDQHMEDQDCLECHHKYKNGENILDEGDLEEGDPKVLCASCHNNNRKAKLGFQRAFHKQCLNCHNQLSKANMKSGPSLCGECHIRSKTG